MAFDIKKLLENAFTLTPVDAGEFATMKVSGMNFKVSAWDAEGFGRISLMEVSGMLGLMKMNTLVFNAFDVDAPLLSYDRIQAFGNDSALLEVYDTLLDRPSFDESGMLAAKESASALPEMPVKSCWYDPLVMPSAFRKKSKKKDEKQIDDASLSMINAYLEAAKKAPSCDRAAKAVKNAAYSNGLVENGGPATDAFVKAYGQEKTREFFQKVLFGE